MTRWYIAILIYFILVCLLLALRPSMMFQENKDYRRWGMVRDKEHSIFSVMFIFPLLAFVSYYLAAFLFMVMT